MKEVLITTIDDGSQWVMLEDYQLLQQNYLLGELVMKELLIKNSLLLNENNHCKDLLYSIHETVSQNCNDVGETFDGIAKEIAELWRGLTPRAADGADICPHCGRLNKLHCGCNEVAR